MFQITSPVNPSPNTPPPWWQSERVSHQHHIDDLTRPSPSHLLFDRPSPPLPPSYTIFGLRYVKLDDLERAMKNVKKNSDLFIVHNYGICFYTKKPEQTIDVKTITLSSGLKKCWISTLVFCTCLYHSWRTNCSTRQCNG